LQGILVGLVFDGAAQAVADGQGDESEDGGEQKNVGHGCNIGEAQVELLGINCPVQGEVEQVEAAQCQ